MSNESPSGWYNDETGEWELEQPSLPAFMKEGS